MGRFELEGYCCSAGSCLYDSGIPAYHFGQVVQGIAAVDGVYADGLLADVGCARLFEELAQVRPRFCLFTGGDGVFEIVSHTVDVQAARFV